MDRINKLDVFYHDRPVGTMALLGKMRIVVKK